MFRFVKRLFQRKRIEKRLTVEELEEALAKAKIMQREAMHQTYFSHQPFIDFLERKKTDAHI